VANLIDALDKSVSRYEKRFSELVPDGDSRLGFGAAARQQPERRDWMSILGNGPSGGANWMQSALGSLNGRISWGQTAAGYNTSGPLNLSGFADYNRIKAENDAEKERQKNGSGTVPGTVVGPIGKGATGADANTDKWRDIIDQAASEYGIDGDVIQAIMMIESGGNERAQSGAGAIGLMQVMPFHWGAGEDPWDPKQNVFKGAKILADNYKQYGNWDSAVAAYLGAVDANGNPTTSTDLNGTSGIKYAQMFNANVQRIKQARAAKQPATPGTGVASMFGGKPYTISQEFGRTAYSTGEAGDEYAFGTEFGLDGHSHTGWDVGTPDGTAFYMPAGLSGTVVIAGGSGYYTDDRGDAPGKGELRIQLDNGMVLILGHNSGINVRAGQKVTAGMLLGMTGKANGAHQHIEVRVKDPSTRSGWRIVDPATLFGTGQQGGGQR
jgi:murein DD-endopeptidase MepM/ murein hydrolase activator NlpD